MGFCTDLPDSNRRVASILTTDTLAQWCVCKFFLFPKTAEVTPVPCPLKSNVTISIWSTPLTSKAQISFMLGSIASLLCIIEITTA